MRLKRRDLARPRAGAFDGAADVTSNMAEGGLDERPMLLPKGAAMQAVALSHTLLASHDMDKSKAHSPSVISIVFRDAACSASAIAMVIVRLIVPWRPVVVILIVIFVIGCRNSPA